MPEHGPNVAEIANLVARQLQAQGVPGIVTVPAGAPPRPAGAPGAIDATSLSGSADIAIIVGTTTYELKVAVPTTTNPAYSFTLTMTPSGGQQSTLAQFVYKDSADWSVTVGLPTIQISNTFSIKTFSIQIQDGSP